MIPYARQSVDDRDVAAVAQVLRSDFLTQGPVVPRFEQCVASYCAARFAVASTNATSALHLAAKALGLETGGLLWTSPISFVASANCGLYCGAQVDFVDIDPQTLTMSTSALEAKLAKAKTDGRLPDVIVTVDFAGTPGELEGIAELRDRYGFRIIEDASHAIGARYRGDPVGSGRYSDVTVFSFHPVKIITTAEGGMALTNDPQIAQRMRLLRSHGVTREPALMDGSREPWEYEQIALGFNYRLTELQAALGIAQMERLDEFIAQRARIADRYDRALTGLPLMLPQRLQHAKSANHLYPVQVRDDAPCDRRTLYERLRARDIAANVHYMPIYLQPYYRALGFAPGHCPNAESYYAHAISLPMFSSLTLPQQQRVIDALADSIRL